MASLLRRPRFANFSRLHLGAAAALVVAFASASAACGGSSDAGSEEDASADATVPSDGAVINDDGAPSAPDAQAPDAASDDATVPGDASTGADASDLADASDASDAAGDADAAPLGFDVEPSALQTLRVAAGATMPAALFTATLDGAPVRATWQIDRGLLGSVTAGPSSTTTFTPSGAAGGLVTLQATFGTQTVVRHVFVQLTCSQNGATSAESSQVASAASELTAGSGIGGVGGEGLGPAVTDANTLVQLAAPTSNGQSLNLTFLYPYNSTVWPLGLPAPLLQWSWNKADADAIAISLSTSSGSFSCATTFARPAILSSTGGPFVRHPIPQDIWTMATRSANGKSDPLTVSLTVAKSGLAYGPVSETWTIAPVTLDALLSYQSYGVNLVENASGAVGGNGLYGGYVASLASGAIAPSVVAGTNTATSGCRACHSVARDGSRLIAQHGDNYAVGSAYTLSPTGATEHVLTDSVSAYGGIYLDGSFFLSSSAALYPLPTDTTALSSTGLTSEATNLGAPTFSPDGTRIAFNPGAGAGALPTNQALYVMTFDDATRAFSGATLVADDSAYAAAVRPSWPAFFPDSQSLVFHQQSVATTDTTYAAISGLATNAGARAQIEWTNGTSSASVTPLDNLNGKNYLPKLAAPVSLACLSGSDSVGALNADHSDDVDMNYEPTVSPIAAGGYAWVAFVSRRMYGSVTQIPPYCSDPRGVDLVTNISPKKIWLAAVDLDMKPGTDASHPAFYYPGQELLSSNGRPVLAFPACLADGQSCATGDQCCNGYCGGAGGSASQTCQSAPSGCAKDAERCTTAADCCTTADACIDGFCSLPSPQ